jgi:hypothetical protein
MSGRVPWTTFGLAAILLAALAGGAPAADEPSASPTPSDEPDEVKAFVKAADDLIYDRSYDSAAGKHYKVKSDDPRIVPRKAAELLDGFRDQFDRTFDGRLTMRPYEKTAQIYLFYSRFKYKQLSGESSRPAATQIVGHYAPFLDIVALHTDTVGLSDLPDVLVHEATHQLVQQRLYGEDVEPMPWICEGLANYFGSMLREESGTWVPGKIGSKNVSLFKSPEGGGSGLGRDKARAYARLLKSGEARPLDEMIRMSDLSVFYGPNVLERYTAGWLLVHYLMQADGGAHAGSFMQYLAREIREDTTAEDFYKDIGMNAGQLQEVFAAYVRKL